MRPLFSIRQKATWCALLAVPALYMAYLLVTLPAAERENVPWWLLPIIALSIVQIITDFRMLGAVQQQQLARAIESPSHQKLYGLCWFFISITYCYIAYNTTHADDIPSQWVATALAAFMVLVGNYQVALGQPKYEALTFNTPFMRRYGDLVLRGYRLAGRLLFAVGILVIGLIWLLPAEYALPLLIGTLLSAYLLTFCIFWVWYFRRRGFRNNQVNEITEL